MSCLAMFSYTQRNFYITCTSISNYQLHRLGGLFNYENVNWCIRAFLTGFVVESMTKELDIMPSI